MKKMLHGAAALLVSTTLMGAFGAAQAGNTFPSSGDAGIGTTSPSFPLEIDSAGGSDALALHDTGTAGSSVGVAQGWDASNSGGHKYHIQSTGGVAGQGTGKLVINDETASWADRIVIDGSGNVGIGGVDSPSNRLDIGGGLGLTTTTSTVPSNGMYSPSSNTLALTSGGTEEVVINSTGVGIGTTSPAVALDLSGKTDALRVPVGTTAQRPSSPSNGELRYNTSNNELEGYINGQWLSIQ